MQRPELADDPKLANRTARANNMAYVDGLVGDWIKSRAKQDVLKTLQTEGVPSAIVQNVEEVLTDEHLHERGMLEYAQHPVFGEVTLATTPIRFSGEPLPDLKVYPELGSSNQIVYEDLLDLSSEEIEELQDAGVI